ncbi:MAG: RNA polymerase-associated protein rapA [Magnetococcales bacterium]|nr:RNA polymerase-associated protein rapA [Magnetococcales bacterium]
MKKTMTLSLFCLFPALAWDANAGDTGISNGSKWEFSGYLKNETALFQKSGAVIGERASVSDTREHNVGDITKFENSLVVFVNGDLFSNAKLHAQLDGVYDSEAVDGYRGHKNHSQQDALRELYIDSKVGNHFDLRLGKQQLVWGTADGIKLLDIINPTDWREFNQNTMDESRITVWMAKGDLNLTPKDNLQFVVSQRHESRIPGLNADGDSGQPFIMKGVDAITGPVNGFRSIVPEMGAISRSFFNFAAGGAFGAGVTLNQITNMTVNDFASNPNPMGNGVTGANMLNGMAYTYPAAQGGISGKTNLVDGGTANWNVNNPNSVFEYMSNATFATFDAFVGAKTAYVRDYPDEIAPNLGLRYKSTLGRDFNYSLNYLWHYDPNPYIEMSWKGDNGETLTPVTTVNPAGLSGPTTTVTLPGYGGAAGKAPTLTFTEKLNRIHSMGAAFDTTFDTAALGPVVGRGEFLYQKGTKTPVIDRTKLGYGDLVGGMKMEEADQFKYVLGTDLTFFTNLMVNMQFIQFINLDYVDEAGTSGANSGRYTGDQATLSLTNGLRKGAKYREFVSLFFSKPFGAEQQGRVNNITIAEESGGYWNRFDVEYGFTNAVIGTAEVNNYWGNEDTMFGQFKNSSNIQVGLKYLF